MKTTRHYAHVEGAYPAERHYPNACEGEILDAMRAANPELVLTIADGMMVINGPPDVSIRMPSGAEMVIDGNGIIGRLKRKEKP